MSYLFFDTETTGLPRVYDAPPSVGANWPRIVSIAWAVVSVDGRTLREFRSIVRPVGFQVPAEATRIHGITHAQAVAEGRPLADVLGRFAAELWHAEAVLAHNLNFDRNVVASEFLRTGAGDPFVNKASLCTMRASVDACKIPPTAKMVKAGINEYKTPGLAELYRFLFGADPTGQHDSLGDVRTTARCFYELRRRGLLPGLGAAAVIQSLAIDVTTEIMV